jgi:siroheme decarboxylase
MNASLDIGLRLLNDFQRDFPLVARPYAEIATHYGIGEESVIAAYRAGLANGVISRVGAVLAPLRLGASTLAAMAVPAERLDSVAAVVSAQASVNHNYEREGSWNLWFVVTAADTRERSATLAAIEAATGLPVLSMPLVEEYHIDLGFDLLGNTRTASPSAQASAAPCALPEIEKALLAALQDGLPLSHQPYAEMGARAGLSEAMTLELLANWLRDGLIKRLGVIVRHRELGYTANAMCVWDIPDGEVSEFGRHLATVPGVTLCYRRQRTLPDWPYNLYCMIHGKQRADVEAMIEAATGSLGLDRFSGQILFSRRCFKQCGSRYSSKVHRP